MYWNGRRQCLSVMLWMPDTPGGTLEVCNSIQEDFQRSGFLILYLCGTPARIHRVNSDTDWTVPVVSDLDKLLNQCLSQHAVTFVLKPSLSISLSPSFCLCWSQHASSLSFPHAFPLFIPPSVDHSVWPLSFLASLFRLVSRFCLPKCYYLISAGVSDIQIHQIFLFLVFAVSSLLLKHSLLLLTASPKP